MKIGLPVVLVVGLGLSATAGATPVTVSATFSGSDCAGGFGTPFDNCDVGYPLGLEISPIIAKYDLEEADWSVQDTLFPSIDGSEFDGDFLSGDDSTGSWDYTPGADDPEVRYWVAKAGSSFTLFWVVDDSVVSTGGATSCDTGGYYTESCLRAALAVTSGSYTTPGGRGLSHISFYDTGRSVPDGGSMAMLLGAALMGLAGVRRLM
jgi:hypothetical protein